MRYPLLLSILFQTIRLKYTTVSNSAFITGMVVLLIPIFKMVKNTFEGSVYWYGETIKLDLEARKMIERINAKPERYRVVH
jgi:hypothetical protein